MARFPFFQRVSAAPTSPKPVPVARNFDVADLSEGPLSADAIADAELDRTALARLMGDVPITVATIGSDDKVLQYTSDLQGSIAG